MRAGHLALDALELALHVHALAACVGQRALHLLDLALQRHDGGGLCASRAHRRAARHRRGRCDNTHTRRAPTTINK
eukprot:1192895-Prorocentrum_minimum.AAC.2